MSYSEEKKDLGENEETAPKIGFEGGEFAEEEGADDGGEESLRDIDEIEDERNKNRRANLHALKVRRAIEDYLEKKKTLKDLGNIDDYSDLDDDGEK